MVGQPKISLIASSVRPQLYEDFFRSLEGTSVEYEVVFAGNVLPTPHCFNDWLNFKYILTENIKPAQCYEIARRHATGELVCWVADDCEFKGDILWKAYSYWKRQGNQKLILSLQTMENGYAYPEGELVNMNVHRFFGGHQDTPLMAPIGLMDREWLQELGGFDRRFICGQYENFLISLAYTQGAVVEIFGGQEAYVEIDHLGKSIRIGESKNRESFQNRPFATGYSHDRKILEENCILGKDGITIKSFEPYEEKDLLTKSQSYKGMWK